MGPDSLQIRLCDPEDGDKGKREVIKVHLCQHLACHEAFVRWGSVPSLVWFFLGIIVLQYVGHLRGSPIVGLMATSSKRAYATRIRSFLIAAKKDALILWVTCTESQHLFSQCHKWHCLLFFILLSWQIEIVYLKFLLCFYLCFLTLTIGINVRINFWFNNCFKLLDFFFFNPEGIK